MKLLFFKIGNYLSFFFFSTRPFRKRASAPSFFALPAFLFTFPTHTTPQPPLRPSSWKQKNDSVLTCPFRFRPRHGRRCGAPHSAPVLRFSRPLSPPNPCASRCGCDRLTRANARWLCTCNATVFRRTPSVAPYVCCRRWIRTQRERLVALLHASPAP